MTNEEIIKFLQSKQIPQCGDKEYTADEEYEAYQRAIDVVEQQPCDDAQKRYEDLCEYFGDAKDILKSRKDFKAWLERIKWHIRKAEELYEKYENKQEPCEDAISRDAVKKWICKTCPDDSECQRDCDVIKGIDALPPVTPQQKYGKWIGHPEIETSAPEYLMFYECSECGDKPCFCKSDIHKKRFCSNCGCHMVEPQESESDA